MCHAAPDPKYMMRDVEDRVKSVAFGRDTLEEPGQIFLGGLLVRLREFFRRKKRKDLVNG